MYRRIELISHLPIDVEGTEKKMWDIKGGICVPQDEEVIDVWHDMPIPKKPIMKNCRFYFTERGWKVYGRAIIKTCQKVGQEYRVICIKENSVDIFYKDEIQVVVRPLRKHPKKPGKNAKEHL